MTRRDRGLHATGPGVVGKVAGGNWGSTDLRKIIGTVLLLALVATYAVVAVAIAAARLAEASAWAHFTYFLFTGLLWLLPAMAIIRWMIGPGRRS